MQNDPDSTSAAFPAIIDNKQNLNTEQMNAGYRITTPHDEELSAAREFASMKHEICSA